MLHRIKILLSILSILTYLTAEKTYSQHIVFNEITSEQDWLSVLKKSETEKKPVFLDIYASWCGPCKKMDAEVFANPNVADFYNENFINSKIDGESPFGVILVREFMLKGFPSMYYVDSEKFIYSKLVGFRPPEIFLDYGKTINNNKDLLKEFALSFETGRLHGEKIKEYIDLLTRIDYKEPIAKINTLFINSMNTREILLPGNKEMIINSALQFESEPFRIILEQHDTLMALWGEEDYLKFLENVFQEGIQKAAKEENVSLRDRLADELIPVYFRFDTVSVKYGKFLTRKLYQAAAGNWAGYITEIESYFNYEMERNYDFLIREVYQILQNQYSSEELYAASVKWLDKIPESKHTFESYYMGAIVNAYIKDFEKSDIMFGKARTIANPVQDNALDDLREFIKTLKSEE